MSRPPPGSWCSSRAVVVCRPRPSSRMLGGHRHRPAGQRVGQAGLAHPGRARPSRRCTRGAHQRAQPVEPLAGDGADGQDVDARRRPRRPAATAAGTSGHRSALVRTTTGVAPLAQATARYRSIRRSRAAPTSASTTRTRSTLAATTCGADPRPAAVRTNAVRRGSTRTASSPAHRDPVADRRTGPVAQRRRRACTRCSPSAVRTVSRPRSTRATRATRVPSGGSGASSPTHPAGARSLTRVDADLQVRPLSSDLSA